MKCKAHFPITLPTLIINLFPVCQSDVEEKLAPSFISSLINWRRKWQPTPVLLPAKFHGWRSLVGYSPWGRKESDTTKRLHFLSGTDKTFSYSFKIVQKCFGNFIQHEIIETFAKATEKSMHFKDGVRDRGAW